ncbi:MAG: hypothetical protein QOH13_2297 [Thermoleophilaceae bacterium]|nr:hypothetical protein [Thermoleophilaceae bacterium]
MQITVRQVNGRWMKARTISGSTYGAQSARVVIDRLGGMTVAWVRSRCRVGDPPRCGTRSFVQARSASAGGRWGPIETLGRASYDPALAVVAEARGGASVAWQAGDGIHVARHASARRFDRAVSFGQGDGTPALTTSIDGRAYIAFATIPTGAPEQDVAQPFIAVAVRDRDGHWQAPRQVSGRPAAQPRLTVAADGALVVAWRESALNTDDMPRYGGVGAALGSADGNLGPVLHVADARTTGLLLAAGPTGETVLAWSSPTDVTGPLDYAIRADKTATFGPVRRVPGSSADLALGLGTLAVLDDGRTLFVGPNAGRTGVRLAVRPARKTFSAARLILRRGSAPMIAVAGPRAAVVYLEGSDQITRVVTLSRR